MKRILRVGAVVLLVGALAGACSGGNDESATSSEDAAVAGQAPPVGAGGGSGASAGGTDGAADGVSALPDAVPASARQAQVIRTAELRIELKKGGFREAFERATFLAGSHQGFVVDSSSERGGGGLASGAVVLRVPTDRFDAARKDLATLGQVRSEQVKGQDVGAELVDLKARLRNLRAQEESLRELMQRSASVPDTMQVQQNLFAVRGQIEQLAAQEARLEDGVAMATIRVALAETGAALLTEPEPEPTGIAAAFGRAVDGAVAVVSAIVITIGYLFPLLVVAGGALVAWRLTHRERRVLATET